MRLGVELMKGQGGGAQRAPQRVPSAGGLQRCRRSHPVGCLLLAPAGRPTPLPPLLVSPCLRSHLVRAGLLHTIQQRLAADGLAPAAAGAGCGKRQGGSGVPGTGQRHVPLLLRAKEPAVEERLLKLAAAREAGGPVAAAAAADGGEGDGTGEQAPSKATEAAVC